MGISEPMNNIVIKSFEKSLVDIFLQIANINLYREEKYLKNEIKTKDSIIVLIGIHGDLKGYFAIEISEDIVMRVASKMMEGLPNIIFDDNVKGCIIELASMIVGNAILRLIQINVNLEFTPPSIICGKNIELYLNTNKILSIPFKINDSKVELYLDLE